MTIRTRVTALREPSSRLERYFGWRKGTESVGLTSAVPTDRAPWDLRTSTLDLWTQHRLTRAQGVAGGLGMEARLLLLAATAAGTRGTLSALPGIAAGDLLSGVRCRGRLGHLYFGGVRVSGSPVSGVGGGFGVIVTSR